MLALIVLYMNEPKLTILGVYRPQISAETWQEQWQVTEDDKKTKEHFDQLVLIEAMVEGLAEPFDMGSFGQMHPEFPDDPSRMLVGYDEGLLSPDGETLIQRDMDCVTGTALCVSRYTCTCMILLGLCSGNTEKYHARQCKMRLFVL